MFHKKLCKNQLKKKYRIELLSGLKLGEMIYMKRQEKGLNDWE